jgi:hypothetical protein
MAISQTQIVDYLLKKIGYGVAKTDTSTAKGPSNEANASPLLSPGVTIWQQDFLIPSVTVLSSANSAVVTVYRDSLSTSVQAVNLAESTTNQTWATNLTNWIPTQYGSGYQLQLYAAPSGTSTPQTTGVSLPQAGSGNSDSWFFDYQSGLINFADTNVPTAVTWNGSTGNVVYAVGARYTGQTGISNFLSPITFSNTVAFNANITATNVAANGSAVFSGNITANTNIIAANGSITANTNITTNNGNVNVPNGNVTANYLNGIHVGNVYTSNIFSSFNNPNITFSPAANGVIIMNTTTAMQVPVGSNSQYPGTPTTGMIRYNTSLGYMEVYTGSSWTTVGASSSIITSDIFNADGSANSFVISQNNTTSGTLVTINGVMQIPGSSYTVSGNVLTFNETPVSTDVIEARSFGPASAITNLYANSNVAAYLPTYTGNITAGNITVNAYINANAAIVSRLASISVGAAAVVIDTFDKTLFRSAKYVVQVSNSGRGDYETSEYIATHNDTTAYGTSYGIVYSNVELGNVSVAINSGNVELTYTGNYAGNIVKLFKEYIPV